MNAMRNYRRGSFLIEAMLAVVILGCAVVVLMRSYAGVIAAAHIQRGYTKAVIVLQDELDMVISKGFMDRHFNQAYQKIIGEDVFEIKISAKSLEDRRINQVQIDVAWPAGSLRQRSVSVSTYLLDAQLKDERHAEQ